MDKRNLIQLAIAIVLLAVAGGMFFQSCRSSRGGAERAYFYDLSEQRLFVGPLSAVPPIRGVNDEVEDGVRAVVISLSGDPKDAEHRQIAYLEKYSAAFKQQIEQMRAAKPGETPATATISRASSRGHIFVRRTNDVDWYPLNSAEAERIIGEWQRPGPDGRVPVVCVP
jgi:hypothetical protein